MSTTNAETPAPIPTCANCDAPRQGNFCASCGQRHRAHRLSLRMLGAQLVEVILDLESGLLLTLREMLLDPSGLILRYSIGGLP